MLSQNSSFSHSVEIFHSWVLIAVSPLMRHTSSPTLSLLSGSSENLLSISSCLAFRASVLISVAAEHSLSGCGGSFSSLRGGRGTENFLAMLCRTQQALIMLDFLSKEPSCAYPRSSRHLKRLFRWMSAVCMMLWIFAWASLKRVCLAFAGSDTGVKTCLLN